MDTHQSSLVLRKHLKETNQHQLRCYSVFQNLNEHQKLEPNDSVRIRNRKKLIRKEASIFHPQVSHEVYTIERIRKDKLPYLYQLHEIKDRFFYGWQLVKVDRSLLKYADQQKQQQQQNSQQIIEIVNATKRPSKILRNNKVYGDEIIYEVIHNGQKEYLDKNTLLLYQKLFKPTILRYAKSFYTDPNMSNLII